MKTKSGKKRKVCKECESNAEVIKQLAHDGIVLQRQLDAVATEEWDALKEEISKLRKSLEVAQKGLRDIRWHMRLTLSKETVQLSTVWNIADKALASL